MKTVCSSSMPFVEDAFRTLGKVTVLEGRSIGPADVADADALAVRSTTKVTEELLRGTAVRFVGSATIGTDHMDIPYMERSGIHWCYSPGCNANSVGEYIVSALLWLAVNCGVVLQGKTLGIVGVGNVGKRVAAKAQALGLHVLQNDPPRKRAEPENAEAFVELDELLHQSDIVTIHVPLTRDGQDATFHLADKQFFDRMRPGAIFLNAARGAVVDTNELVSALGDGQVGHAVIDTWEGEPSIPLPLLEAVDLGTPHIAGYSFEGKVMGTVMVYEEACRFFEASPTWDHNTCMPLPTVPRIQAPNVSQSMEHALAAVVHQVYDIGADAAELRQLPGNSSEAVASHFDRLRGNYPVRREFRYTCVDVPEEALQFREALAGLEFVLA